MASAFSSRPPTRRLAGAAVLFVGLLGLAIAACTEHHVEVGAPPAQGIPDACFVRQTAAATQPTPDGGVPTPAAPAEPLRCANDAECGAGARCDTQLSPPKCVVLYCVPEGQPCSSDEQCASKMTCHAGKCNPCNTCGNLCEVDFTTDPKNCGQCGVAAVGDQTCVDGVPTCTE
jgi:hypothetical protein